MKLIIETYLGPGAKIQHNLFAPRREQLKDMVGNLTFNEFEHVRLKLLVEGEIEEISQMGLDRNGEVYTIRYKYPLEKFIDVPLKEKNDFLTSIIMNALVGFYETNNQDINELFLMKEKFIK